MVFHLADVQNAVGYEFKNPQLLLNAFTHASFSDEKKGEKNNERFYGQVYASGTFDLTGPTHMLLYDIKGRAEKGTEFCIDGGNTTDFQLSDMIEFVPPRVTHIDSLLQNIKKKIRLLKMQWRMWKNSLD